MMSSSNEIQRRLVPRWRSLADTLRLGELGSDRRPSATNDELLAILESREASWNADKTIQSAGELIEAAITSGREVTAKEAAQFVLRRPDATTLLRASARLTLSRDRERDGETALWLPVGDKEFWRRQVRTYPGNALAWVELAFREMLDGRKRAARRCMQVATQLAPDNRHVLRAASRLFLHLQDPDHALWGLRRTGATTYDPWLASAEIAISSVARKTPKSITQGRQLLSGDFSPRDLSELAGAIATEELVTGRRKKARDLFRTSSQAPTGNAFAQVAWASPNFPEENFVTQASVNEADEAEALRYQQTGDTERLLEACTRWARSEPYSIRPLEMASAAAAELELYEETITFADLGLKLRPHAPWLLNNKAYALANLGEFDQAEIMLHRMGADDEEASVARTANEGLILMKRGSVDRGVALYVEAIRKFREKDKPKLATVAGAYLAKAAAEAELPYSPELIQAAKKGLERTSLPSLVRMLDNTLDRFELGHRARNMQPIPTDISALIEP